MTRENDRRTMRTSLGERLKRRLVAQGDCLVWTGNCVAGGYGRLRRGGRGGPLVLTHRAAYEIAVGPIPDGLDVLHSCDNPPCCNPRHLRLGTDFDNARDRKERGREVYPGSPPGEYHGQSKLHDADVRAIRERRARGETQQQIAEAFGVSRSCIGKITNRILWKHLD